MSKHTQAVRDHFLKLHAQSPIDVAMLPPHRHAEARTAFDRRDGGALRECLPPECFWRFLHTNEWRLKHAGMLEPLCAYGLLAGYPAELNREIQHTLGCCEAWVLRRFGDPLPEGETVAVHRPLAHVRITGHIKRIGWWLDPERAAFEALTKAYSMHWLQEVPQPGVVRMEVPREDVVFVHAGRAYFKVNWRQAPREFMDPMPVARERPGAEPLAWDPSKCSVGPRDGVVVHTFGTDTPRRNFGNLFRRATA